MARIRTIKPEFFTSEDIVGLSPFARLLYIALWCEADKEGRMTWKPNTFKLRYLPGDAVDIQSLAAELVQAGLVVLYGDGYAVIPKFRQHQHINPRESDSQLPEPDASSSESVPDSTRAARVRHASARVDDAQGGREGKGKEGKGKERALHATLPESVPAEIWSELVEHRWAIGKPMTDQAVERMLAKLSLLASERVNLREAVDTSIRNGWQDVFAPKPGQKQVGGHDPFEGAI